MSSYQNIFDTLISSDYHKIGKTVDNLINDKTFLDEITVFPNPFVFDRFTKMVQYKMDTSQLCENRNKYLEKVILNDKINVPDRWLTEYIISYFFQDDYYNFMANLFQMVRYLSHIKEDLINKEHLKIYNEFVDLNKLTVLEKQEIFKKYYSRNDIMEMFYGDISILRDRSHKELVDKTIKLNNNNPIYSPDFSRRMGVDVYYLDGEDFFGFVRCFSINRGDLSDNDDYIYSRKNQLGYSFSCISNENIGTIDYDGKSVALFYDNIDYRNIMYVHHADLHAKKMKTQDDYLSVKENEITTPEDLIARTNNYNEVYIKPGIDGIKPTALVCYDSISRNDISFAEKYDLPILLIDRKKYKGYEAFDEGYNDHSYNI